jgi:hypothetical protein
MVDVIGKILGVSYREAVSVVKEYAGDSDLPVKYDGDKIPFTIPSEMRDYIARTHRTYLMKRRFNPDWINERYGVVSTSPHSTVAVRDRVIRYGYRLFIPVYWGNQLVTYQCRSVVDDPIKYLACPSEVERMNIKEILYASPEAFSRSYVIVTEGVTDVWRMGDLAVATFGIQFKQSQVSLLCDYFKTIYIMYDPEPTAQIQAQRLKDEVIGRGRKGVLIHTGGVTDPGSLSDLEAAYFIHRVHERESSEER